MVGHFPGRSGLCAATIVAVVFIIAPVSLQATPVTTGLELWLDGNDSATLFQDQAMTNPVTADGQFVQAWADKSGLNNDATRNSNDPVYKTNIIGGKPVVRFNRGQLTVSGGLNVAANQDRTVFLVMSYTTQTNNNEMFGTSTSNMADVGNWSVSPWRLRLRQTDNLWSPTNAVPSGANLLTIVGDTAGTDAWRHGNSIIDSTIKRFHWAMNDVDPLGIGGANFAGRDYIGDIAEMIVYDRALTPAELNSVGYYLEDKYDLDTAYIPEPTAFCLAALGLLGLLACGRRRRLRI